jgi:hypothetical protein
VKESGFTVETCASLVGGGFGSFAAKVAVDRLFPTYSRLIVAVSFSISLLAIYIAEFVLFPDAASNFKSEFVEGVVTDVTGFSVAIALLRQGSARQAFSSPTPPPAPGRTSYGGKGRIKSALRRFLEWYVVVGGVYWLSCRRLWCTVS